MKQLVKLPTVVTAFVARPTLAEQIRHALGCCSDEKRCSVSWPAHAAPLLADSHTAVLHGSGGVGKSQLALYHAHQVRPGMLPYRLRWWIAAEQHDALQLSYRELAKQAGVSVEASCELPTLVSAVNAWLSGQRHWLLVFDNVPSYDAVRDILPATVHPSQHVILTSRHTHWPAAYRTVPVDVMDAKEAMALLKAAAAIQPSNSSQDSDISLLVSELGRLPLALSQAGACIAQLLLTVSGYRQEYADSLLDGQATMPTGDLYQQAVASTWNISIKAVEAKAAAAGIPPLLPRLALTAAAYLDPDGIPRSLLLRCLRAALQGTAAASTLATSPSLLQRLLIIPRGLWHWTIAASSSPPAASATLRVDSGALNALLALLHSFSLTSFTAADSPSIRIHRVLGRVLRHQHQQLQRQQPLAESKDSHSGLPPFDLHWCRTMADAVILEYKQSAELRQLRDGRLLSQMQSLRQSLDRHGSACGWLDSIARAELLSLVGDVLLFRLRDSAKAKVELEASLAIFEAQYGSEHVRVARELSRLGVACIQLGEYSRARELLERSLRIKEANYGADDVELAPTLGNMGAVHRELGEYAKAKEMQGRALAISEAHYGPNHVKVAATLDSLAAVYGSLGDHCKARELQERALVIQQAQLGTDHIEGAVTMSRLGSTYSDLGEHARARDTLQRALDIKQAYYGQRHIELAPTLVNLGMAYGALGDHDKARELLERALTIQERHYGSEHVQVAKTLNQLGRAYGALGDHAEAKAVLERALRLMEAHYGQQQQETIAVVLTNLSIEYAALGDAAEAAELRLRAARIGAVRSEPLVSTARL